MRYARFDEDLTKKEKDSIMIYYIMNVKKHLYFQNRIRKSARIYLAKSPAYICKIDTIYEAFPGCKVIYLERDPVEALPSWISMNSTVFRIFNSPKKEYPLKENTMELLKSWLHSANEKLSRKDASTYCRVDYNHLIHFPGLAIKDIYSHFHIVLSDNYERIIDEISLGQKNYKSPHSYSLQMMGLDKSTIEKEFAAYKSAIGQS